MIRESTSDDFEEILSVINDSARSYQKVIPDELYQEPFLSNNHLTSEVANGLKFSVYSQDGQIVGVMGVQDKGEVVLIRHSYVRPSHRRKGIGSLLLAHHIDNCYSPILVGCLESMTSAISFYQQHGFILLEDKQRDILRAQYWTLPENHVRQSVVLADHRWFRKDLQPNSNCIPGKNSSS